MFPCPCRGLAAAAATLTQGTERRYRDRTTLKPKRSSCMLIENWRNALCRRENGEVSQAPEWNKKRVGRTMKTPSTLQPVHSPLANHVHYRHEHAFAVIGSSSRKPTCGERALLSMKQKYCPRTILCSKCEEKGKRTAAAFVSVCFAGMMGGACLGLKQGRDSDGGERSGWAPSRLDYLSMASLSPNAASGETAIVRRVQVTGPTARRNACDVERC
jgi:hypothetical protein